MKIKSVMGICSAFFCALFLLPAQWSPACALTFTAQTKEVTIDDQWRINGRYSYRIRIMEADDARQIQELLHQLTGRADRFKKVSAEIRIPGGGQRPWDVNKPEAFPDGTTIDLAFEISTAFPGFAGLFSDYMHIDQSIPLENADYRITFPKTTPFSWQVVENHKTHQSKSEADSFSWSGNNIRRLDIMVSTAESWEEISQRYQIQFQEKLNGGLSLTDIPEPIRRINEKVSRGEQINAVISFLGTEFSHRTRRNSCSDLVPDTPSEVLDRRWGDCKDIALMGTAMLQFMGIDAFVALTGKPRMLNNGDSIPDPFIFDHAMIGITENGRTEYYDPFNTINMSSKITLDNQQIALHLKVLNDAGQ